MPDEIVEEETHPSSVQFEGRKVELHGVSKTGPLGIALLAFLLRLLGPLLNVFIKRTKKYSLAKAMIPKVYSIYSISSSRRWHSSSSPRIRLIFTIAA